MKYGKSKVLICEIMGCQDILKRATSKRPTCQKLAFQGQIVSEILAQLSPDDFIITNPSKLF